MKPVAAGTTLRRTRHSPASRRIDKLGLALPVLVTVLAAATGCQPAVEPARAWVEDVVIPTYPLQPDDVHPHFLESSGSPIYPYTMQDGFSSSRVDHTYRAVFVENEYLRVMALPELGGRIQSVYDKIHDEEMFYRNHVIRPGHIALRGAWVSGGIEWNRGPQGHTVTSFSPVDVIPVENPDGSATLVIGNTEMNFRTGWEVRLTLHPGRAYLDELIALFNPTDGVHPYYFWNNTAFPNRPGTRFMYPMTLGTDHNGENFFAWPIHQGRDLSWLRNYPEPTSVFGYQVEFDFFGAYDVDRDYGIVQVADHTLLPGKKAWTWGESDSGRAAQSVLTDDDGPYIEVQSGPLPTQADFEMLQPGRVVAWRELWYPVAGLGEGFEYANEHAAVQREGNAFRIMTTATIRGAALTISQADGTAYSSVSDLQAGIAETNVFSIGADELVTIELADADGNTLLRYRSPLEIPERRPPDSVAAPGFDAESLFARAFDLDKQGLRVQARAGYERALAQDAEHLPAHLALGVLDAEAGLYTAAVAHFERVVRSAPDNGMAWYLLGAAELHAHDLIAAAEAAAEARRQPSTRALGHLLAGRIFMRQGASDRAVTSFEAATSDGGAPTRSFEYFLLADLAVGDALEAAQRANDAIGVGTVRLVPHAVAALSQANRSLEERARDFARATSGWVGEPEFSYLELTLTLADLGLFAEASALLQATLIDGGDEVRPLPLYTLAYLADQQHDGDGAESSRRRAAATAADYVFPSRPAMIPILRAAIAANGEDGRAHLYLGNLYAGLGRADEAIQEWRTAVSYDESLTVALRNLGITAWRQEGDLAAAASWYRRAVAVDPDDPTLLRDLAGILIAQGRADQAILRLEQANSGERRRADVIVLLARTYADQRRYDDAIALLEATTFTNREGDAGTWQVFTGAHIERGMLRFGADDLDGALADFDAALSYPTNLNAGRPHEPHEARAHYWRGQVLAAMGREQEARGAWQACVDGVAAGTEQEENIALCRTRLLGIR